MSDLYRSPDGRNHTLWESISDAMDAVLPAYGSNTTKRREERGWMFRGHSDANWKLVPTLYREPCTPTEIQQRQVKTRSFVDALRSHAAPLGLDKATDDDLLAIAQHYGFPTAHLDFTFNVEVAAYFATSTNPTRATVGVIYGFNVSEYRQMRNPFSLFGTSQEQAEKRMRSHGITPLPPLRTIQLTNVPRVLQQEAVFLEMHEEHVDTVMHNCIERFYFKQGTLQPYAGGAQSKLWMLPDRSSFRSEHEFLAFVSVARAQRPSLFEGTPYVGEVTIFPEDDNIRRFAEQWIHGIRD